MPTHVSTTVTITAYVVAGVQLWRDSDGVHFAVEAEDANAAYILLAKQLDAIKAAYREDREDA